MDDTDAEEHQRHLAFVTGSRPSTPEIVIEDFETLAIDTLSVPLDPRTEQASTALTEPATASPSAVPTIVPTYLIAMRLLLDQSCSSSQQVGSTKDITRPALLKLPAEILNMILKLVLIDKSTSIPIPTFVNNNDYTMPKLDIDLSILRTCKQLHAMGTLIFFQQNIFNLEPHIASHRHAPFGSHSRGLSPMNWHNLALITHLEVDIPDADLPTYPPRPFNEGWNLTETINSYPCPSPNECWKLDQTINSYPCRSRGWGLAQVQWIQCVLTHPEFRHEWYKHCPDPRPVGRVPKAEIGEASRSLDGDGTGTIWDRIKIIAKLEFADFLIGTHILRIVGGLPEPCKAFSRVFLARQEGRDHVTTLSVVLMKGDGEGEDEERQAAISMSRSRGIYLYAELDVDVVAGRVRLLAGDRAGEYFF
jgi:hypothetical protein